MNEFDIKITEKLDVLLVKPGMYPQRVQIDPGPAALLEVVHYFDEDHWAAIVNEKGTLNDGELNRAVYDPEGNIEALISGNFLVVGLGMGEFCSLDPEQLQRFEKKFHQPQMFVRMGESVVPLPMPDEQVRREGAPAKAEAGTKAHQKDNKAKKRTDRER